MMSDAGIESDGKNGDDMEKNDEKNKENENYNNKSNDDQHREA
jgi:hypothetical protein